MNPINGGRLQNPDIRSTAAIASQGLPGGEQRARARAVSPVLGVMALTLAGCALRIIDLGNQSYWYDESITVGLLRHTFGAMLSLLPRSEGTPPVYYVIAWVWARVFGFGEGSLRSLSAVAGTLVVPTVYAVGATLISRRVGLIAAALAAFSPFLIWYSQEARSYSLMVLLASLALLAFVHARPKRPATRWLVAWAVASSLALATHYFAAIAVAPQAAWLLWLHRRDRRVWLSAGAVSAVALALLPLALDQAGNAAWIAATPLGARVSQIAPQFLLGTGAPARNWLKLAGALGLALSAGLLVLRASSRERAVAVLALELIGAGLLVALLLIVVGFDELISRNIAALLLYVIVLIAAGLGSRRAGAVGLVGATTLCSIGVIATIAVDTRWEFERPDWGGVARVLQSKAAVNGARAILVENTDSLEPLNLYLSGFHVLFTRARVRELDVVAAVKAPSIGLCWWGAACSLVPVPLDTTLRLPGWRPAGPVLHLNQFSIYRLRAARSVSLTRAAVSRAINPALLFSYGLFVAPPS